LAALADGEVTTDTDGDAPVSADLLPGNNELGRSSVVRCDSSTIRVSASDRAGPFHTWRWSKSRLCDVDKDIA